MAQLSISTNRPVRALLQLDALQSESQQLTSANEAIKQSLAEQAALPDSGLEPLRSWRRAVFIA